MERDAVRSDLTYHCLCTHTYTPQLGLWGRENGTFFEDQKTFMEDSGFKHSTGALELIAMGTSFRPSI